VLQATVWATTCAEAEIASKDALLLGEAVLRTTPAVLVTADAHVLTNMADQKQEAA